MIEKARGAPPVADDSDRDAAFTGLYRRLVQFFSYKNWAGPSDLPHDLAQETLARGLEKIAAGVELRGDHLEYFWGVARNVELEHLRSVQRAKRHVALDERLPDPVDSASSLEQRLRIEHALGTLADDDRALFLAYYVGDREGLPKSLGINPGALRVRVHRLRCQLDAMITETPANSSRSGVKL